MYNSCTLVTHRILTWYGQHVHLLLVTSPRPGLTWPLLLLISTLLSGCSALMSRATGGMAANLSEAILNQDDPETVRDGVPAYLLTLDSFVAGAPEQKHMGVHTLVHTLAHSRLSTLSPHTLGSQRI